MAGYFSAFGGFPSFGGGPMSGSPYFGGPMMSAMPSMGMPRPGPSIYGSMPSVPSVFSHSQAPSRVRTCRRTVCAACATRP